MCIFILDFFLVQFHIKAGGVPILLRGLFSLDLLEAVSAFVHCSEGPFLEVLIY